MPFAPPEKSLQRQRVPPCTARGCPSGTQAPAATDQTLSRARTRLRHVHTSHIAGREAVNPHPSLRHRSPFPQAQLPGARRGGKPTAPGASPLAAGPGVSRDGATGRHHARCKPWSGSSLSFLGQKAGTHFSGQDCSPISCPVWILARCPWQPSLLPHGDLLVPLPRPRHYIIHFLISFLLSTAVRCNNHHQCL